MDAQNKQIRQARDRCIVTDKLYQHASRLGLREQTMWLRKMKARADSDYIKLLPKRLFDGLNCDHCGRVAHGHAPCNPLIGVPRQ